MTIEISPAHPNTDLQALAALLERVAEEDGREELGPWVASHRPITSEALKEHAFESGSELHVAEYSLTPVGMVRLIKGSRGGQQSSGWAKSGRVISFDLFAVEPAMRGMGIGDELLDFAEARARELGAADLACDLPEASADVIAMLERRGYRRVARIDESARLVVSRPLKSAERPAA